MFGSDGLTVGAVTTIPRHLYAIPTANYPWWTYLNNILYGDPCITIWEATPGDLEVSGPSSMDLGDSIHAVTVEDDATGLEGAVVVMKGGYGEYGAAVTDASGNASVPFRPRGTGEVDLVVTRGGFLPYETSLNVTGSGGRAYVSGVAVNDDDVGSHTGNGDGEVGWGERIGLGVGLANGGTGTLSEVTGTLRAVAGCSLSVYVEFTGSSGTPPIYIGGACSIPSSIPFGLNVGSEVLGRCTRDFGEEDACWIWLDSHGWHLRLNGAGTDGFAYRCSIEVHGEVTGYGTGHLEPGDELTAAGGYILLEGDIGGTDFEDGVDFQSGYDAGIVIHDGTEAYGSVGSSEVLRSFDVEFVGGPGDGLPVWLEVTAEDAGGNAWRDWFPVVVHEGLPRVDRFTGSGGECCDLSFGLRKSQM